MVTTVPFVSLSLEGLLCSVVTVMLGCVTGSKPSSRVWTVNRMGNDLCICKDTDFFFFPIGNKDVYVAESVQANNSKNQVQCCHKR